MPDNGTLTPAEIDELKKGLTEYKPLYAQLAEAIKQGKPQGEILTKLGKLDEGMADFQKKHEAATARLDAIEEKQRQAPAVPESPKSIGQRFIEDPGFLAFVKQGGHGQYTATLRGGLEQKDMVGISRAITEFVGVGSAARLPLGVRSLVPQGRTTSGAVQFVEETSFTNSAAPVAEGAAKPKSDKVFNPRTLPVETIAHIFKISRQMYDDLPAVASQIESNGIYGVKKAEDNQLLNGTGTSPQLKGFNPVATDVAAPALPATLMDSIGTVIFTLASAGYMADGLVLNPADWAKVALAKNSQGNYLFANPIDYTTAPRIWGVRMVMSTHQAAGTFLVGAFQGNSLILDREEVNVQIAEQNVDDFEKNMLTIRVEERLVLLIFQPAAFANGATPA
jgi:HK97 family phage major capsid protein